MAYYDLEEQEQIEALKAWWRQWGGIIALAVTVAAVSIAAWVGWNWYRADQAVKAAAVYTALGKAMQAGDAAKAKEAAVKLVDEYGSTGYAPIAALAAARLAVDAGEPADAKARLQWVIDKAKDEGLKDLARLRLAAVLLDEKQYDAALALLDAKAGAQQTNLQADLRGDILVARGSLAEARAAYQSALEKTDARSPYRNLIQIKIDGLGDVK